MIAYVFWHWRKNSVAALDYENRQQEFHSSLAATPPAGFSTSFSLRVAGAPWVADGLEAYEDWYIVNDFSALGALNEGAVSGSRSAPHDAAANAAEGGAGGLYLLRQGVPLTKPRFALWFSKPAAMSYPELLGRLDPVVAGRGGALWMRQLVFGPAREFCIHAVRDVSLPPPFETVTPEIRNVWPR